MAIVTSGGIIGGYTLETQRNSPRRSRFAGHGITYNALIVSNGASTKRNHLFRIITQTDWGFEYINIKLFKNSYDLEPNMSAEYRIEGYYSNFAIDQVSSNPISQVTLGFNNFGPGGSSVIHDHNNGGYYRTCYGRDFWIDVPYYAQYIVQVQIIQPSGFIEDNATPLTTVYNAPFGGTGSQSTADNFNYGRGIWCNAAANMVE